MKLAEGLEPDAAPALDLPHQSSHDSPASHPWAELGVSAAGGCGRCRPLVTVWPRKGRIILGMLWRVDTTIASDRNLHCLQLGRITIRNLAAQAANLASSGNSRFDEKNSRFGRFNSRFGRKTSRLFAYGNSPTSACFRTFFSPRLRACKAKIAKIPSYSGSTGIWAIAAGPLLDLPDRPEAGVSSPYRLTSSSSEAPRRARSGPVESR
jgi:hypothetical protein